LRKPRRTHARTQESEATASVYKMRSYDGGARIRRDIVATMHRDPFKERVINQD